MKIVRSKTTYQVFYMFENKKKVRIDTNGLWADRFRALDIKPDTHEIVENIPKLKEAWSLHAMGYNNGWFIYNQERYDELYEEQLQVEIEAKCVEVQRLRMQKTYTDTTMQFPDGSYNEIQFRNDFDRQNVSNLALGALAEAVNSNPNKKIKFRDKNNKVHNIKAKDMVGLALGVMEKKQRIVEMAWGHKDTIRNFKTLEDVRNFNVNAGWPED